MLFRSIGRLFETHHQTHGFVYRKLSSLEKVDHRTKIFRQRISRTENIQFLLHEESGFVGHGFFRVADVNDAASEGDFLDGGAKGLGKTDGFDDDVGSAAVGEFQELIVER